MSSDDVRPIATAGGTSLTLGEWIEWLRLRGHALPLLREALLEKAVIEAGRGGSSVADAELQEAADDFRRGRGLTSAAETHDWLERSGLTVVDLEDLLERGLLIDRFRNRVAEGTLAERFEAEREFHGRVKLREILVASSGLASELVHRIEEEGADFGELARERSIAVSAPAGGDLGVVSRTDLPDDLAEAIFRTTPGRLVGPVLTDRGARLFLVEAFAPPVLDERTASLLRDRIFAEWSEEVLSDFRTFLNEDESP